MAHGHDEVKEPATTGQIITSIILGFIPFWIAITLVIQHIRSF